MEISVAFLVRQVRDADPPCGIFSGSAQIEADWSAAGSTSFDGGGEE